MGEREGMCVELEAADRVMGECEEVALGLDSHGSLVDLASCVKFKHVSEGVILGGC